MLTFDEMNLIIDIGNSTSKLAVFRSNKLIDFLLLDEMDINNVKTFFQKHQQIKSVILSSVQDYSKELAQYLQSNCHFIVFDENVPLPIKNLYKTPHTLGNDRLAAAVGGNVMFPNQNILIIDAGTCITYDFVNAHNEYVGGAISPGIDMRFTALHTFTDKLPLVEKRGDTPFIGQSTENAILSGVQNGILSEVEGMINRYSKQWDGLIVIFTGGNRSFFEKTLIRHNSPLTTHPTQKSTLLVESYLVLKGLNVILLSSQKYKGKS